MLNLNLDTERYDSEYAEDKATYSPSLSHDASGRVVTPVGGQRAVTSNQPVSPQAVGFNPAAYCPAPPSPSLGGEPGPGRRLGWSTGLRSVRWGHRRFNDESMTVGMPTTVHPVEGPVGFSTRTDRLVYGSEVVLNGTGAPTNAQVTAMYSDPDFAIQVAAAQGSNPAYI